MNVIYDVRVHAKGKTKDNISTGETDTVKEKHIQTLQDAMIEAKDREINVASNRPGPKLDLDQGL